MVAERCECAELRQRSFADVREALHGVERDRILEASTEVAHSPDKWMWVFRCARCGALWAQACSTSGQMDLYYLFPVPPTDDAVRWLHEEAEGLRSPPW
jgi:hypothetical protein